MTELLIQDRSERERAFKKLKESKEVMVNRLRDWESGQIIWGCDCIGAQSSTGKTYTREEDMILVSEGEMAREKRGHVQAKAVYETMTEDSALASNTSIFYWVGTITSVRVDPVDSMDPGEPPLKFARLEKVQVLESTYHDD